MPHQLRQYGYADRTLLTLEADLDGQKAADRPNRVWRHQQGPPAQHPEDSGNAPQSDDGTWLRRPQKSGRSRPRLTTTLPTWTEYSPTRKSTGSSSARPTTPMPSWLVQCLEAGKQVFCEKPLAMTIDEARRVQEAVHRIGIPLMSGWWFKHSPVTKRLREVISAPRFILFTCRVPPSPNTQRRPLRPRRAPGQLRLQPPLDLGT